MEEYEIEITETLSRVVKVKAENLADAIEKASDLYYGEKVVLDAEDMKGVDFTLSEATREKMKKQIR